MNTLRNWLSEAPFSLALSSGFFGFYAHAGFALALYEEGFIPEKFSGASAGAIVAAALASGMNPADLREAFFALEQKDFWDPRPGFGFLRGKKLEMLGSKFFADDFSGTALPLKVVAFDILKMKTATIETGSVARAVRASCAIPLFFHPVRIGKKLYWDGGIRHKSAICATSKKERVFCHYLHAEGVYSSYESKKDLDHLKLNQRALVLKDLPAVSFNSLEPGKEAFKLAYNKTKRALDVPIRCPSCFV